MAKLKYYSPQAAGVAAVAFFLFLFLALSLLSNKNKNKKKLLQNTRTNAVLKY